MLVGKVVKDPDNLLGWVSTPIDFFFRKLVGGFNPKWKKNARSAKMAASSSPSFGVKIPKKYVSCQHLRYIPMNLDFPLLIEGVFIPLLHLLSSRNS